ncbi:hypothetical protein Bca4012_010478 [Brassica carinata]
MKARCISSWTDLRSISVCREKAKFGKMVKKLKGETPSLPAEEDRENTISEKNPDREAGEIGSEERSSHETPIVGDVQPNEEEGYKEEGNSSQTLSNCGDTRVCNSTRVAALEEENMNKMEGLDKRLAALEEEDVNKMEGLDRRVAALEVYVEKVGEDSPKDVKTRQKNGKGVKRTMHTLDDNLSRTMTRSKKQK